MHVHVITATQVEVASGGGGSRANAKKWEAAIRRASLVKPPKTGGEVDTSARRVATQFRGKVRDLIAEAFAEDLIDDVQHARAKRILRAASVDIVADIVDITGAYTLNVPGIGAVVMESSAGSVGKLTTAGERTEKRLAKVYDTLQNRAHRIAEREALQIAAG